MGLAKPLSSAFQLQVVIVRPLLQGGGVPRQEMDSGRAPRKSAAFAHLVVPPLLPQEQVAPVARRALVS